MVIHETIKLIVFVCDVMFVIVIDEWTTRPVVGENYRLEFGADEAWEVLVKSENWPQWDDEHQGPIITMKSDDINLFLRLCDCVNEEAGWTTPFRQSEEFG